MNREEKRKQEKQIRKGGIVSIGKNKNDMRQLREEINTPYGILIGEGIGEGIF